MHEVKGSGGESVEEVEETFESEDLLEEECSEEADEEEEGDGKSEEKEAGCRRILLAAGLSAF